MIPTLSQHGQYEEHDQHQHEQHHDDFPMHGTPLMLAWLILANLTVLAGSVRWFKYSFIIHLILGASVIILTLLDGIKLDQHKPYQKIHNIIGLIVTIWLGVQSITGVSARVIQYFQCVDPRICYIVKRIHYYSSYGIIMFAKLNYLIINYRRSKWGMIMFYLIFDAVFVGIYYLLKNKYWNLSQQIIDKQLVDKNSNINSSMKNILTYLQTTFIRLKQQFSQNKFQIPSVKHIPILYQSQRQISIPNYVIFNDYVYNTRDFQQLHPGGEKIIKQVNQREIDRFIYGFLELENYNQYKMRHKHSAESMSLCGQPIAKIQRISPIKGYKDHKRFKINSCRKIAQNSNIFILHLSPSNHQSQQFINLQYEGFKSQKQIGQYFSLTIYDQKGKNRNTRLYTTMWSQRQKNLQFMDYYFPEIRKKQIQKTRKQSKSSIQLTDIKFKRQQTIPLMIKLYKDGEMTPRFLGEQEYKLDVILSSPMGAGMKYDYLGEEGKVIILCGGTGIFPFYDFIDLLFKRVKLLQNTNLCNIIAEKDPLITTDLIKGRSFIFYIATDVIQDISLLTISQLNYLSKSPLINFKTILRIGNITNKILQKKDVYKNLIIQRQHFQNQLRNHIKSNQKICKVYICGPQRMNHSIYQVLVQQQVDKELYHFM